MRITGKEKKTERQEEKNKREEQDGEDMKRENYQTSKPKKHTNKIGIVT